MNDFNPKLVDTHGHVNFNAFKEDGDLVVNRALDAQVGIIMPGSQIDTSKRAIQYAEKFNQPYIRAAIGLHPIHLEDIEVDDSEVEGQIKFHTRKEEFRREAYEDLLKSSDKIVAIGEIGLDYWRLPPDEKEREQYKNLQIDTLRAQLDLALDYNLPVILHCRKAHDDLFALVANHKITTPLASGPPGVVHCYTGNKRQLQEFLKLGWYIGYNGIIFKLGLNDVIRETPLDRILLETDSPYLIPPTIQSKRNEPTFVKYIAEKIAQIKGITFDEIARQTTDNAKRVFRI